MLAEDFDIVEFFYKRIVQLRQEKGVSAREMSLALGQTESYMKGIESKRNFPSINAFFYICDYLGITPMEFFDTGNKNPLKISELNKHANLLTDEELEHIILIISDLAKNRTKKNA